MSAQTVLDRFRSEGIEVRLDGDGLLLKPASRLNDELRVEVRRHKAEILTLLATTATSWRLADGATYFCPPESRAEVEMRFGQAAEPFVPTPTSCRTCINLTRPGLSDGYCSGRTDLALAYGEGHPLRRLPADGGVDCLDWSER